jgi:hypothetical protein
MRTEIIAFVVISFFLTLGLYKVGFFHEEVEVEYEVEEE